MRMYKFTQRTFEKWYATHKKSFEVHIYKSGLYVGLFDFYKKRFHIKKVKTIKFSPRIEQKMWKLERLLQRISY